MPHVVGLKQKDVCQELGRLVEEGLLVDTVAVASSAENKERQREAASQAQTTQQHMRSMPSAHLWEKTGE